MQAFTILEATAAPLLLDNVDTDVIIRVEPLFAGVPRDQLGPYALATLRLQPDGSEDPACVLNQPRYRGAGILLAGANFGCGSSREGAVWALMGLGFRCVVAPSFGDIFQGNCYQNGLLPITLPAAQVAQLAAYVQRASQPRLRVDLQQCTIGPVPGDDAGLPLPFTIPQRRRDGLLRGLDELELTLAASDRIDAWQHLARATRPWLLLEGAEPAPDLTLPPGDCP